MMKFRKFAAVALSLVLFASCFAFAVPAYSNQSESRPVLEEAFAKVRFLGDADHNGRITAFDARAILRYSADLDTEINDQLTDSDKQALNLDRTLNVAGSNEVRALDRDLIYDIDGDGKVTAIDARIALRISGSLENLDDYRKLYALDLFNAGLNNIKVPIETGKHGGLTNYYYGEEKQTYEITINNESALNEFSRQMNALIQFMDSGSETIDLAESLKADKRVVTYTSNSGYSFAYDQAQHIPINGLTEGSFLTPDDIIDIEISDSIDYHFISYYRDANGNVVERQNHFVPGLYAITVHVAADHLAANRYPSNLITGSHSGRVFDLPDRSNVESAYREIQELQAQMNSYKDQSNYFINKLGIEVKKFNLNVNFNSLDVLSTHNDDNGNKVIGSYVTLYINPQDGMPVGADYMLKYDLNVNMYLDIDMQGGFMVGGKDVVVENENVDIINTLYTQNRIILKNGVDLATN